MVKDSSHDNQERRSGNYRRRLIDRRQFSYSLHFPEHRNGNERRSGLDRRQKKEHHISPVPQRVAPTP